MKRNKPTEDENIEIIEGNYDEIKDFKLDDDGYFLIKLDRKNKKIVAGFCKENNKILVKITGNKPADIYQEVLKSSAAFEFTLNVSNKKTMLRHIQDQVLE